MHSSDDSVGNGACTDRMATLLNGAAAGDPRASAELLPLVYAQLRALAGRKLRAERPDQTLQATALVHEAWLRLGNGAFVNRAHFFCAASEAMRRILIEGIRRKH